ncbi:histidine phosphatase family protein [Frigidibacter sp. ROC022]|uniref:histidine phosphatase family protein n=1 Tax=Frigidibacter sp. ROC022 TaxID=2971796 RepID=UPI00215B056F|nr:histidine phosphatase family protein [Frigidibacter sp. ROC022]MCR8726418.1 histidine phosphatase family protein [Frigidibacter sp. ROC022]
MSDIYILRHGQTEWNAARRMQGALDSPLTELGRAQARRQGEILRELGADGLPVHVSPQGRAQATAALALPEARPITDARLREISLGAWDGLTAAEIAAQGGTGPEAFGEGRGFFWYDTTPGEGFEGVAARARSFVADLQGPAVIVTHGITSMFLRGALLGLSIEEIAELPGGQGVVHHLKDGIARRLE